MRRHDHRLLLAICVAAGLLAWPTASSPAAAPVPPPVQTFPAGGANTPPDAATSDPITPGAECGGWQRESRYADQPTDTTWWEYTCSLIETCGGASCDANFVPGVWTDHFYWNGSSAVYYGQWIAMGAPHWFPPYCDYWIDAATSDWYGPYDRTYAGSCTWL
jgi:hypothetical protein